MKAVFISLLLGFCSLAVSKDLNLEELASAITEHNKQGADRITSLEDLNELHLLIEGARSADHYKRRYKLTRVELIKRLFGNIEHLTIEELPQTIINWNLQQETDGSNHKPAIASAQQYDKYCDDIYGALSYKTYQKLYDITFEEFVHRVFGNSEYFLALEELPQAITEYNKYAGSRRIHSFETYRERSVHITGALSLGTYQVLNNLDKTAFIKFVFSRVDHLTLDELPQAVREYHNKIKASKISSLISYGQNHMNIPKALSFNTYRIIYGVTEEEFEDILKSAEFGRNFTAEEIEEYERQQKEESEHHAQSNDTNNEDVPLLTLTDTPQAIMEYNRPDAQNRHVSHPINSWVSYEKYHDRIPGADTIRNLEEQFQEEYGTRYGFIEFLLGQKIKTLTPIELSTAISQYNDEASLLEQIGSLEEYEIFSYRIPHAPTLEAFRESVRERWNELFQKKFGTVENYVEFIIVKSTCQELFI